MPERLGLGGFTVGLAMLALTVAAAAQPVPAPSGHPTRPGVGAAPSAPPVEARQLPPGILDVTQSWRVHEGDDAAWADPDFDDSDWPLESLLIQVLFQDETNYAILSSWQGHE